MSSLNITSWTPEEIGNWIKGLDNALEQYIPNFITHQVSGDRLLKLTIEELDKLNITKMGHKELMLEAIHLLSVVHYGHPKETLQSVALKLNCKANSLANLIQQRIQSGSHTGDRLYCTPSTILLSVSETISAAKTLISWLDRPPFSNSPEKDFQEFSKDILNYALEMTQAVQQQSNLTDALPEIMAIAREFAAIADNLIKQSTDPLVIQPTTIDEVRIKKKQIEEELGLFIKTSTIDGIHYITGTKDQSAASLSRKVGCGDELLRVNEQTVVSWEHCKVIAALRADPMGVYLTLRKRPCNLGSPGQILRPSTSPYTTIFGTPQLMRKDSFHNLRSPIVNEDFLMPTSPLDLLVTKARSNSDPEPPSDTHEIHSDQETERIKRQRRGTIGESLQRKGSKVQVTSSEGRPRSLPINTEDLEAEMELMKASGMSSRPNFSPIAGSPPSVSTQTTPSPHGTPNRTINPVDTASSNGSCPAKKVTISEAKDSSPASPSNPTQPTSISNTEPEISRPTDDHSCLEVKESPAPEDSQQPQEPIQRTEEEQEPKEPHSTPETAQEPSSENSEAKNTNNNVAALAEEESEPVDEVTSPEVSTFEAEDYVVVEVPPESPKTVTFIEMSKQSSVSSLTTIPSPTFGVKLRPKKTKRKYKVTRDVSCVDLGPGECQGWLYKKSDTKQKFRSNWVEMWFVLRDFVLYYYKSKKDIKAKGVVCLPGYHISEAPEVKREFAFKATHQGTKAIYFAALHADDRNKWLGKLSLAAIMYNDEKKMRQSIIFSSQESLDMGDMMKSVHGYHSESDDEDKEKSAPLSPSSSDKSNETSSEVGSPRQQLRSPASPTKNSGIPTSSPKLYQKRATRKNAVSSPGSGDSSRSSPKIVQRVLGALRRHSRGSLSFDPSEHETLEKISKRRNSSPFDGSASPPPVAGPPSVPVISPGASYIPTTQKHDDPLLDSYRSIMDNNACVVGFERTAVRTSKRLTNKNRASGLKRIHTVLDKNPMKNKKALQRRALQRTLKAKQVELDQLEAILGKAALTSDGILDWKKHHEDLLDHILQGPKPGSPSDSDSDIDPDENVSDKTKEIATSTQKTLGDDKNEKDSMAGDNTVSENTSDGQPDEPGMTSQSEASTEASGRTIKSGGFAEETSGATSDKGSLEDEIERNGVDSSPEVEPSAVVPDVSGKVKTTLLLDEHFMPLEGSSPSETSF